MVYSNEALAAATKPYLARLRQLIRLYNRAFDYAAGNNANEYDLWQFLTNNTTETPREQITHQLFVQRDVDDNVQVRAQLQLAEQTPALSPFSPYGQQIGHSNLHYIQKQDSAATALLRYGMFATGHVEVSATVRTTDNQHFQEFLGGIWGRLALDSVTPPPTDEQALPPQQVGPQQVEALGAYVMHLLRTRP